MKYISILLLITISFSLFGQDADEVFTLARKEAFAGNREEARKLLEGILKQNPGYHEVRTFIARTFYWDSQLESSRLELDTVLSQDPNNTDALSLLVDVEMADGKAEAALKAANKGLGVNAMSEDFLYKAARALVQLNRRDGAAVLLATLLSINPAHTDAVNLMNEIKTYGLKNTVGVQYGIDIFSRTYRPANYFLAQLARTEKWGTGIVRVNYANRFSSNGLQGEIDLYPKIAKGVYAYVNYGYSKSGLFPLHRAGGEIYSKLPRSFEASLGARYLYFSTGSNVVMYTGSATLYYKNFLFSYRPFLTPSTTGTIFSSQVNVRRYFENGDNFIGITGGIGFSPDERRIQSSTGLSSDAVFKLKTQRLWINWQKTFSKNYMAIFSVGVTRQELSFSVGNYVLITNISVGIRKRY